MSKNSAAQNLCRAPRVRCLFPVLAIALVATIAALHAQDFIAFRKAT